MDPFPAPSNPLGHGERTAHAHGEQEHVEKKPVLKKVKDKVLKIKKTIANKTHGSGGNDDNNSDIHHQQGDLDEEDDGYEESEEMEQDRAFHGAPMYESSAADARIGAMETERRGPNDGVHEKSTDAASPGLKQFGGGGTAGVYGHPTSGPGTGHDEIERGRIETDYENPAAVSRTGNIEWGRGETDRKSAGLRRSTPDFVEDPAAPNSSTGIESRIGGEEVAISPGLNRSVEAMTSSSLNGAGQTQNSEGEHRGNAGGVVSPNNERGEEEQPISPELHRSFDAMSISDQTEVPQNKSSSYADKISAVKDKAFSVASESALMGKKAASMAYEKAAGAGSVVMAKVKPEASKDSGNEVVGKQDNAVSMRDYVSGKLSPGEDDKALSQVITEALTPGKGGAADAKSPASPQKAASGEGGGALGVVGKIKETVTSYFGGGGSPRASPAAETHAKENNDYIVKTPEALSQDKYAGKV